MGINGSVGTLASGLNREVVSIGRWAWQVV